MPNTKTNRFGLHQKIFIRPFRVDETGLITGTIEYHIPEDFDAPNFELLDKTQGPVIAGLAGITGTTCVGVERIYDEGKALAIYTFSFEGLESASKAEADAVFELDVSMREEPIETHPNFEVIGKTYFWDSINRRFPPVLPTDNNTGGINAPANQFQRATNPLYGQTSYLVPGVIYRRSYAAKDVSLAVLSNIGVIVVPPAVTIFPSIGSWLGNSARNWLKLAPKIRRRGNAVSITEEYLLSGPRGWQKEIYSGTAFGNFGDPTGSGIHTSSL